MREETQLPYHITYVHPRGAFAASTGSFVLIPGNVAAMSNGTSTGAATSIEMVDLARNKTVNYIASYVRSIAEKGGGLRYLTGILSNPQVASVLLLVDIYQPYFSV